MSNHEILQVQLKHFQKNLDEAITNHYYKIVFIHGVGNGRLKQELVAILKGYKNELNYRDGDYKKYGFGATEVIIKNA
jgi:dsDNA-specific endonuclease/ATPase MutS2